MKYIDIKDASIITGKTVQALYQAAKRGKLWTKKIGGTYYTDAKSLREYQFDQRFADNLIVNGKRLYCQEQGFCSVKQAALMLRMEINKVYRCLCQGVIKSERVGRYYVIPIDEINRLINEDFTQYA